MYDFEEQDYSKGFEFSLWRKLLAYAFKYRMAVFMLIFTNTVIALNDQIVPLLNRYAIDRYAEGGVFDTMPLFIAGYVSLAALQSAMIFFFGRSAGQIEAGVVKDIRHKGFDNLQRLSFSYFDTTQVGWIMARMTSDAQKLGDVIAWGLFDILFCVASILLAAFMMFMLNWKLALVALVAMPLVAFISYQFQKRILRRFRESRKINSKITASYNEGINGAKTTKTLTREGRNFGEFRELSSSMKRASLRAVLLTSLHFPIVLGLTSIGLGSVVWAGGVDVLGMTITIGTFSAFLSYAQNLMEPIMQIASILSEMQSAQASGERTMTLIETVPEIQEKPEALEKYGDALAPKPENWEPIRGAVEFRNVTFKYKTGETVLEDFNLTVKPGEKIALVGETGSGKSTIVNLVCRFYEPTEGQVLIDGVDYRERSQIWLQSALGYVLQSPHLFSGTIRDNIRYAKLDATEDEIAEAAKMAGAWGFISKLEKGLDADVGEGGGKLSLGEKQLVSFARAILGHSKLFVLDEATASVDTETEQKIQAAIETVLEGKTSFIVAHRLSTIRYCDRILVISDGKIAEEGSHKQLLRKRGEYYRLYTNQFKEEAGERLLHGAAKAYAPA